MASIVNEWRLREPRRRAQRFDMVRQQAASPVQQIDGEEPASAGHEGAAIIRHSGNDMPALRRVARRAGTLTRDGGVNIMQPSHRSGAMRSAYCALRSATAIHSDRQGLAGRARPLRRDRDDALGQGAAAGRRGGNAVGGRWLSPGAVCALLAACACQPK